MGYTLRRNSLTVAGFGASIVLGLTLGIAIPSFEDQSLYRLVMLAAGGLSALALIISGNPHRVLLFALIMAIPLNLFFSPFGDIPRHSGGALPGFGLFLYDIPLFGLTGIWVLDVLVNKRNIRFTLIDVFALLFILWNIVTLFSATNALYGVYEIIRMIKLYFLAHIVAASLTSKSAVKDVLIAVGLALLLQCVIAGLQYAFNTDLGGLGFIVGDMRRVSGTVGWPNTFGAYIAAVLCVMVSLWVGKAFQKRQALLSLICVAGLLPLIMTFSRGAWVGFAAGLVTLLALSFYAQRLSLKQVYRLLGFIVAGVLIVAFFSDSIVARFSEDTLNVRGQLNDLAIRMIETNPVLGIGVNNFLITMREYDIAGVTGFFAEPVHNVFLLISAESGVIGLALFLIWIVVILRAGVSAVRSRDRLLSVVAAGVQAGIISILVSNLADVHLKTDVMFSLFWLFIGLTKGLNLMTSMSSMTKTGNLSRISESQIGDLTPVSLRSTAPLPMERGKEPSGSWGEVCFKIKAIRVESQLS